MASHLGSHTSDASSRPVAATVATLRGLVAMALGFVLPRCGAFPLRSSDAGDTQVASTTARRHCHPSTRLARRLAARLAAAAPARVRTRGLCPDHGVLLQPPFDPVGRPLIAPGVRQAAVVVGMARILETSVAELAPVEPAPRTV